MFLKKKQTDIGTDDVLQQIKEKISSTGKTDEVDSSHQFLEQNSTSQNTSNSGEFYSDEDSELLNILLNDDNEDDDEDDNSLSDIFNKEDDKAQVVTNDGDNIVDNDVDTNNNEEAVSHFSDTMNNDNGVKNNEYAEELEGSNNENSFVVDDVLNGLKAGNDQHTLVDDCSSNDGDIDEDDIEFYDKNNDEVDGENKDDDTAVDDYENSNTNSYQPLIGNDYNVKDDNDIVNSEFDGDEANEDGTYDDNQPQVNEKLADVAQLGSKKPLYQKQKDEKVNKSLNVVSISDDTKRSVKRNISNLIEQVRRQVVDERGCGINKNDGGKTLEQIAIDLIHPVVIDYLNNNLERIVSDVVNEEIKRITDDIDK